MAADKHSPGALAIYAIVFICGAIVMVVEIVGSRVIAPYAGNSLFVWTSLIGVVLGALALGYWWGGMLADRSPKLETLCFVIFAAGLWIALIPLLAELAGSVISWLGIKAGSLLASAILFAPPSFLLGFVSPYSVKLATASMKVVGTSAGSLYSVSTAGSIFGTLVAGFVLIPSMGVNAVLFSSSAILVITSLYGLRSRIVFASVAIMLIGTFSYAFASAPAGEMYDKDSAYYRIRVVEEGNERVMYLDAQTAGGIYTDSQMHRFYYSKVARLAYVVVEEPSSALVLGLGPGVEVNDFRRTRPNGRVDAVEIDPAVVDVAKEYFGLPDDSQTRIFVEDARVFLASEGEEYDIVFMDAFNSIYSVPSHLTTVETAWLVKARMKPGGAYVVNVISSLEGDKSLFFRAQYKTLRSVFRTVYVVPVSPGSPKETQNIIILATDNDELDWAEWTARAAGVGGESVATWAGNRWNESIRTDDVPLLTDDFAPVDNLMAPLLN